MSFPPARRMVGAVLTLAGVLLAWLLLLPPSLGGATTTTIVSGNSMEPLYSTGDVVVARAGAPQVGDIVVYEAPVDGSYRVIHRIVGGNGADGWVMQGDNNDFLDPWEPTDDDVVGIASIHVPHVGTLLYGLSDPLIWAALVLLGGAVLAWPRSDDEDDENDADDADDADDAGAAAGAGGSTTAAARSVDERA